MDLPGGEFAILVTGGKAAEKAQVLPLLGAANLVVAADQGLRLCQDYGLKPNYVIGDFDSVAPESLEGLPEDCVRIRLNPDKEDSDTRAAVKQIRELGLSSYVILGGGEGRFDHSLDILNLFRTDYPPWAWISRQETMFLLRRRTILHDMYSVNISFYPLEDSLVRSVGLEWELDKVELAPGFMSLSNRGARPQVELQLVKGRVLVLRSHRDIT